MSRTIIADTTFSSDPINGSSSTLRYGMTLGMYHTPVLINADDPPLWYTTQSARPGIPLLIIKYQNTEGNKYIILPDYELSTVAEGTIAQTVTKHSLKTMFTDLPKENSAPLFNIILPPISKLPKTSENYEIIDKNDNFSKKYADISTIYDNPQLSYEDLSYPGATIPNIAQSKDDNTNPTSQQVLRFNPSLIGGSSLSIIDSKLDDSELKYNIRIDLVYRYETAQAFGWLLSVDDDAVYFFPVKLPQLGEALYIPHFEMPSSPFACNYNTWNGYRDNIIDITAHQPRYQDNGNGYLISQNLYPYTVDQPEGDGEPFLRTRLFNSLHIGTITDKLIRDEAVDNTESKIAHNICCLPNPPTSADYASWIKSFVSDTLTNSKIWSIKHVYGRSFDSVSNGIALDKTKFRLTTEPLEYSNVTDSTVNWSVDVQTGNSLDEITNCVMTNTRDVVIRAIAPSRAGRDVIRNITQDPNIPITNAVEYLGNLANGPVKAFFGLEANPNPIAPVARPKPRAHTLWSKADRELMMDIKFSISYNYSLVATKALAYTSLWKYNIHPDPALETQLNTNHFHPQDRVDLQHTRGQNDNGFTSIDNSQPDLKTVEADNDPFTNGSPGPPTYYINDNTITLSMTVPFRVSTSLTDDQICTSTIEDVWNSIEFIDDIGTDTWVDFNNYIQEKLCATISNKISDLLIKNFDPKRLPIVGCKDSGCETVAKHQIYTFNQPPLLVSQTDLYISQISLRSKDKIPFVFLDNYAIARPDSDQSSKSSVMIVKFVPPDNTISLREMPTPDGLIANPYITLQTNWHKDPFYDRELTTKVNSDIALDVSAKVWESRLKQGWRPSQHNSGSLIYKDQAGVLRAIPNGSETILLFMYYREKWESDYVQYLKAKLS